MSLLPQNSAYDIDTSLVNTGQKRTKELFIKKYL